MSLKRLLQILDLYLGVQWQQLLGLFRLRAVSPPSSEQVQSIIVFGYMGLGDAFMFQPSLVALCKRYPAAKLTFVTAVASPVAEIFRRSLREVGGAVDNVIEANYKLLSIPERHRLNKKLKSLKADMCVCTYMTPVPYFASAIASVPYRVGHTIKESSVKPRPNRIFNIGVHLEQDHTHEIERHARLLEALGAEVDVTTPPALLLTDEERSYAENIWQQYELHGKRVIGTHFGASKLQHWKKWDDERFAEVLAEIDRDADSRYLLLGVKDEEAQILKASEAVAHKSINLIGEPDVFQVAALLERCNLMLGNDSGLGHVAMAVKTRAVRVFGMSDFWGYRSRTGPHVDIFLGISCSPCLQLGYLKSYNVHNCGHKNCMKLIGPELLVEAIRKA